MNVYWYNSEKNPLLTTPQEVVTLNSGVRLVVVAHYDPLHLTAWRPDLQHAISKDNFRVVLYLGASGIGDRIEVADTICTPSCKTVVRDICTSGGVNALADSDVITSWADTDTIGQAVGRVTEEMNKLLAGLVNT